MDVGGTLAKRKLEVFVVGDASGLKGALGTAVKDVDTFGKRTSRAAGIAGGALKTLGKAGGAALVAGLGASVKSAASFEKQLDSLGAVAGASGKQMAALRKQALKAGADTAYSASEAALAQTELAKGGLSAAGAASWPRRGSRE